MPGTVILSHGFESGPEATKTTAMAVAAERLGWRTVRPDYRQHDLHGLAPSVDPRCRQLGAACAQAGEPVVLAGSSMGAFVSGRVSLNVDCLGLFLLALPVMIPEYPQPFDLAAGVPVMLVHGHADDRCPPDSVFRFASRRGLQLWMVDDGHRLAGHVDWIAAQFALYLERLEPARSATRTPA